MNKKLIAILDSVGLTHESLNSPNLGIREQSRRTLAAAYPTAKIVCENSQSSNLTLPVDIDGVRTTKPTNRNLNATAYAQSPHALHNFAFVSIDNLDGVILATETVVKSGEVKTGKIGTVKAETKSETKKGKKDETPDETPSELRPLDQIPDVTATTEGATTEGVTTEVVEEAPKSTAKSV